AAHRTPRWHDTKGTTRLGRKPTSSHTCCVRKYSSSQMASVSDSAGVGRVQQVSVASKCAATARWCALPRSGKPPLYPYHEAKPGNEKSGQHGAITQQGRPVAVEGTAADGLAE